MDSAKQAPEVTTINLKFFCLKTERPEEFVDKLEELCRQYCYEEDFYFKYSFED
ncbi:MAG: hypothetical protein V1894_00025 [Chloroflexota bacterium]